MINNIGERVREIRKSQKITLTELAQQTDLSPAYISNLERNLCNPTLDNIQRICSALGIEIVKLLDDKKWIEQVIRKQERQTIFEQDGQVRYESINFGEDCMEGTYIVTQPHCNYNKEWTHSCDEIGFVIEGNLDISIDGKLFSLNTGDSFYIKANQKHNLSNSSDYPCKSLWVKQIFKN